MIKINIVTNQVLGGKGVCFGVGVNLLGGGGGGVQGRGAMRKNTGSCASLVLLGRGRRGDVTRVERVDRVKDYGRAPPSSARWA